MLISLATWSPCFRRSSLASDRGTRSRFCRAVPGWWPSRTSWPSERRRRSSLRWRSGSDPRTPGSRTSLGRQVASSPTAGLPATGHQPFLMEISRFETCVLHLLCHSWCIGECEDHPDVQSILGKIETITGVPRVNYESFQVASLLCDERFPYYVVSYCIACYCRCWSTNWVRNTMCTTTTAPRTWSWPAVRAFWRSSSTCQT